MSQPPNPSPNDQTPRPPAAAPVAVTRLDYQTNPNPDQKPGLRKGWQFLAGMAFAYVYPITAIVVFISRVPDGAQGICGVLAFGVGILLATLIRGMSGWTTFIPGVLCGFLSMPLIGLVICGLAVAFK